MKRSNLTQTQKQELGRLLLNHVATMLEFPEEMIFEPARENGSVMIQYAHEEEIRKQLWTWLHKIPAEYIPIRLLPEEER